ncbi:MAG: hypothetical protein COA52_10180 [Hyphomicrobiales bacterium]|nr:helix-turn-helix transcriptional regulator [Hyphomicrobiales bacterium]PCJ90472.1 MAG: hypothetical protein COA52_10180 [Hyphomicrobiales bacterium]
MEDDAPRFLTTKEIAGLLRVKERKVYELASAGDIPCRRVTGKLLFPKDEIDAWLAGDATAPAVAAVASPPKTIPNIVSGSHDPLLDWAIRESGCGLATMFDGSFSGLEQMASGGSIAAGVHIVEGEGNSWNADHVANTLSHQPIVLIEWAKRQQGMILSRDLQPSNGTAMRWNDLLGKRIIQRQPASGASRLFLHILAQNGFAPDHFELLPQLARTETEAAMAVSNTTADAAPGLEAMARQFDLGFMPTAQERYDLVVDRKSWFEPPLQNLMRFCKTAAFADKAEELGGYDISAQGTVQWNSVV